MPSCEIPLPSVDDAIDVGYTVRLQPVADRQVSPFDDRANVGTDLVDDVAMLVAGDASLVCQIPHRQMMACEMSVKIVTIQIKLLFNSQALFYFLKPIN